MCADTFMRINEAKIKPCIFPDFGIFGHKYNDKKNN